MQRRRRTMAVGWLLVAAALAGAMGLTLQQRPAGAYTAPVTASEAHAAIGGYHIWSTSRRYYGCFMPKVKGKNY